MSSLPAEGRPHRPAILPAIPDLDERLFAVHYSCELLHDCPDRTPCFSALAVRHVVTGDEVPFAAFKVAELRGLAPGDVPARSRELEADLLRGFFAYVARHPDAVWLNWGMSSGRLGFSTLAHRFELAGGDPPEPIERDHQFDLHAYLKRAAGDEFAPHPQFPSTLALNAFRDRVLDQEAAAAAWRTGRHADLLDSLIAKVRGIAHLFERLHRRELATSAGRFYPPHTDGTADGPFGEFLFRWRGEVTDWARSPQPWRLVNYMWGRASADADDVLRELWPTSKNPNTISVTATRAKNLLPGDYPYKLSVIQVTDGFFRVVWRDRGSRSAAGLHAISSV